MSQRLSVPELEVRGKWEVLVKAALFVKAGPNSLVRLSRHFFYSLVFRNLRPAAACAARALEPSGWHQYDFIKEDTSAG